MDTAMTMLPTHPTIPSLMMFYWHRRRKLSEWRKTTLRFPLYVLLFTHFVCLFPCPYTSHFPFPIPSCIPSNASTYPTRIPPLVIGDLGVTMESFWTYVCFCVYFNYIFRLQLFFGTTKIGQTTPTLVHTFLHARLLRVWSMSMSTWSEG